MSSPDAAKPNIRGKAPKLTTERTNGGAYFLDCATCGSLGVWRDRTAVLAAKAAHVCGEAPKNPPLKPIILIGPRPGGM